MSIISDMFNGRKYATSASMKFLGMKYTQGYGKLKVGDKVLVHPSLSSIARIAYPATVELVDNKNVREGDGDLYEKGVKVEEYLKISHEWGGAVINDYLFSRLEKLNQ